MSGKMSPEAQREYDEYARKFFGDDEPTTEFVMAERSGTSLVRVTNVKRGDK